MKKFIIAMGAVFWVTGWMTFQETSERVPAFANAPPPSHHRNGHLPTFAGSLIVLEIDPHPGITHEISKQRVSGENGWQLAWEEETDLALPPPNQTVFTASGICNGWYYPYRSHKRVGSQWKRAAHHMFLIRIGDFHTPPRNTQPGCDESWVYPPTHFTSIQGI